MKAKDHVAMNAIRANPSIKRRPSRRRFLFIPVHFCLNPIQRLEKPSCRNGRSHKQNDVVQLLLQPAQRHIEQEEQPGREEINHAEQKTRSVGMPESHLERMQMTDATASTNPNTK